VLVKAADSAVSALTFNRLQANSDGLFNASIISQLAYSKFGYVHRTEISQ